MRNKLSRSTVREKPTTWPFNVRVVLECFYSMLQGFLWQIPLANNGSIYTYEGDNISVDDIPGETILDTFNAYRGGIIIRYTEDAVWLIINNGSDGDAWGINNLRTGGAGAYAFRTSLESVKDILQTFLERKKAYETTLSE